MAQIGHFDADNVDTNVGFDPVPPGIYDLMISNSDVKATKDGKGKYIWLEHTILSGPFKDRKIFNNLNMWNANPQAVKIAEAHFGCLCKAVGKRQVTDTVELHNTPFQAEVDVEKQDGRSPQNRIKKYLFEDEKQQRQAAVASGPVDASTVPWAQG